MSEKWSKVYIVGVTDTGLSGLTDAARHLVQSADLLIGDEDVLRRFEEVDAQKEPVTSDWSLVCDTIARYLGQRNIVVLATGDPLFYGVARYITDRLGKDLVEIVPHVSTMQLAFARIKESWEDAYLLDMSQRDIDDVLDRIRVASKVGLFTSEQWPPSRIARELLAAQMDYFLAYVCENLGSPDERVTRAELAEVAEMTFSPLNIMILVRKPKVLPRGDLPRRPARFGNPDDWFAQSPAKEGLLTHAEIRAVALAKLAVEPNSVVWDIGAGTGAVAIEAAMLASDGTVYAVERDAADFELIRSNAERFDVSNVVPIHGAAPEVLADLPDPDAVFVGATARELAPILHEAFRRLKRGGRLVVHVATLANLNQALAELGQLRPEPDICLFQVSRAVHQLGSIRFDPIAPSFLIAITKA